MYVQSVWEISGKFVLYASLHARSVFENALGIITLQNVCSRNLLQARIKFHFP